MLDGLARQLGCRGAQWLLLMEIGGVLAQNIESGFWVLAQQIILGVPRLMGEGGLRPEVSSSGSRPSNRSSLRDANTISLGLPTKPYSHLTFQVIESRLPRGCAEKEIISTALDLRRRPGE